MNIKRTFKKTTIELHGVEEDTEFARAGWKNGQIITTEREIINGRITTRCGARAYNGEKFIFHIGFNCSIIADQKNTDTTKEEIVELLEEFLTSNFLWPSFKAFVEEKGYSVHELLNLPEETIIEDN